MSEGMIFNHQPEGEFEYDRKLCILPAQVSEMERLGWIKWMGWGNDDGDYHMWFYRRARMTRPTADERPAYVPLPKPIPAPVPAANAPLTGTIISEPTPIELVNRSEFRREVDKAGGLAAYHEQKGAELREVFRTVYTATLGAPIAYKALPRPNEGSEHLPKEVDNEALAS